MASVKGTSDKDDIDILNYRQFPTELSMPPRADDIDKLGQNLVSGQDFSIHHPQDPMVATHRLPKLTSLAHLAKQAGIVPPTSSGEDELTILPIEDDPLPSDPQVLGEDPFDPIFSEGLLPLSEETSSEEVALSEEDSSYIDEFYDLVNRVLVLLQEMTSQKKGKAEKTKDDYKDKVEKAADGFRTLGNRGLYSTFVSFVPMLLSMTPVGTQIPLLGKFGNSDKQVLEFLSKQGDTVKGAATAPVQYQQRILEGLASVLQNEIMNLGNEQSDPNIKQALSDIQQMLARLQQAAILRG
jgi:hypothetical protein